MWGSSVSSFSCPKEYLEAPAFLQDSSLPQTEVCTVPLNAGDVRLYMGWKPPAYGVAKVSVTNESGEVVLFIGCEAKPAGLCIFESSLAGTRFTHRPYALGGADNQVWSNFTVPASHTLTFVLEPAGIAAGCVEPPACGVLVAGFGDFSVYGLSGL